MQITDQIRTKRYANKIRVFTLLTTTKMSSSFSIGSIWSFGTTIKSNNWDWLRNLMTNTSSQFLSQSILKTRSLTSRRLEQVVHLSSLLWLSDKPMVATSYWLGIWSLILRTRLTRLMRTTSSFGTPQGYHISLRIKSLSWPSKDVPSQLTTTKASLNHLRQITLS